MPPEDQTTDGDGCGVIDLGCKARQAVNGWFQDLVSSASKPIFDLVRSTAMGTPEIDSPDMARARSLWAASQTIANTCYVLLITLGGMLLMAGQSLPGTELTPGELLIRVVAAFLASNLSLHLIGYGIVFANGLATAFLHSAEKKIDPGVLADIVATYIATNLTPAFPFATLLAVAVAVLALCLGFIYIIRVAITMVLIAAAPIALMFHALPMTDGLARLWWRGITGVLAIQVVQSLVLATAYQLLFTKAKGDQGPVLGMASRSELIDLLLAIALLWVMIRVPTWVARTVWQPAQPRMLGRLVKSMLIYRGVGALLKTGGAAVRGMATTQGHRPSAGARQPMPPRAPRRPPPSPPPESPPPASQNPPPPMPTGPQQGEPVQLALPIPVPHKPAPPRPVQLALPIPATRVPRPPAASAPPPVARRPAPRSGQLMLPGMPKRPVPHRQLPLWIEQPKTRRPR